MDMSKLSSNLPLEQPPTEEAFNTITRELSEEFKVGARSIAALYRLSNAKTSLIQAKGYIDCIKDVLELIENGTTLSLDELKLQLLQKKAELMGNSTKKDDSKVSIKLQFDSSSKNSIKPLIDDKQSLDDNFQFSLSEPTSLHFPYTRTPLSYKPQVSNSKYHSKSKFVNLSNIKQEHQHQQKQQQQHEQSEHQTPSSQEQKSTYYPDPNLDSSCLTDEEVTYGSWNESLKRKPISESLGLKKPKFDA